LRELVQEVLEAEMDEVLQAGKAERTPTRLGYRAGYYSRTLVTRVGKLELASAPGSSGSVPDRGL
jgi:transposase-like protein